MSIEPARCVNNRKLGAFSVNINYEPSSEMVLFCWNLKESLEIS